jgi:hypothetical protein
MMGRPGRQLARSLTALTIGTVKAQEARERELGPLRLQELTQEVQVPLTGKATETPGSETVNVKWPYPFVYAPAQRDSPLENPHFSFGVESLSPSAPAIVIPQVTRWLRSEEGFAVGAAVLLTAWLPGASAPTDYRSLVHLTFTGYGAPIAEEDDD